MDKYVLGKSVALEVFTRSFPEDPKGWALENVLASQWEDERPRDWFELLEAAAEEDLLGMMETALSDLVRDGILAYSPSGKALIVPDDRMQSAMDRAGVWYDPYEVPPGREAYRLSPQAKEILESEGVMGIVRRLSENGP